MSEGKLFICCFVVVATVLLANRVIAGWWRDRSIPGDRDHTDRFNSEITPELRDRLNEQFIKGMKKK